MQLPPVLTLMGARGPRDPKPCRCGHQRQAHEHYRRGTDCALCPCQRFRASAKPAKGTTRESGTQDDAGESRRVA